MHRNTVKSPYKKDSNQSYAVGVYPTLELIKYKPESLLEVFFSSTASENEGASRTKRICKENGIRMEISDGLVNNIAGKENVYAVGLFKKFEGKIEANKNHIVLSGIRDMGNLGTICRTMLGFNFENMAIIRPSADIFDPKVVRASMGAIFQLKFEYFENFKEYQRIHNNNMYPFMLNGKETLNDVEFKEPYSLIFGNEAAGLGEEFKSIGTSVSIPQDKRIDSLNLSIAAGIAIYEASKKV
jgi:TrmH family RNA methyltransferase